MSSAPLPESPCLLNVHLSPECKSQIVSLKQLNRHLGDENVNTAQRFGDDSLTLILLSFLCLSVMSCLFPDSCLPEIEHCALGTHGCEHECVNTNKSFVCKCRTGYMLRPDEKTCKSKSLTHSVLQVDCLQGSAVPSETLPPSIFPPWYLCVTSFDWTGC